MTTLDGLPAHVLLVHAVVVLVPLSALLLILTALWPAARDRLVWPSAILAVVALIAVPLTTDAGEWLEHRVPASPLVHTHTELGDTMLPWAIGLAVVALAVLARHLLAGRSTPRHGGPGTTRATDIRPRERHQPGGTATTVVVAVLAVAVAVGAVVTVYRIGESGATAAWTGKFSQQAQPRPGGPTPGGD